MPEFAVTLWVALVSGAISAISAIILTILVTPARNPNGVTTSTPWLLRAPLLPLVCTVVPGLIAIYTLILRFAFGARDFHLPARANIASPILVAATLIAGTLTAAYSVLKLRAHLLAEARGKLDASGEIRAGERHRNDQEAAYSERFAEAVKLLADDRPISRIAGAHLVLAIGDEWNSPGAQQRCFDVLLSHLRGLNRDESFEDESQSRSSREEVRLITSEMLRHLSDGPDSWQVVAGDFSGAVLSDFDLTGIGPLPRLDLRGARLLGDGSIPATTSSLTPKLAGFLCEGDLNVEMDVHWEDLDLANAEVIGSATFTAEGDVKTLPSSLSAQGLVVHGDLNLPFNEFRADVILDSATIDGRVVVGSRELGAAFGTPLAPTSFSASDATFRELWIRRAVPGPRLDLTNAAGSVDLSGSKFSVEVTANKLDVSTGLHIKDTRFDSLLVLDGAIMPNRVDLDGVILSDAAAGAISSSDFALRDQLLALREAPEPSRSFDDNRAFDWRTAIAPYRGKYLPELFDDVERRLSQLESSLPVDWHARPTFTASVMSAVSRAAAKTGAPQEAEADLQRTLRNSLHLASDEQDRP